MVFDLIFVALSLLACCITVYIISLLWFANIHTRQMKSFLGFGLTACLCMFFTAMLSITGPEYYTVMYSAHSIATCISPYVILWFALNFSGSRLADLKPIRVVLWVLPLADALLYATNPLHHLLLASYEHGNIQIGSLFWVHAIFAYVALLVALFSLFRYVFSHVCKASVVLAALSTLFPLVWNLLLALDVIQASYDFTSLGFFVCFALFFFTTYRSGHFSFKSIALTNIFASLSDAIIIVNERGVIEDANPSFRSTFSTFSLTTGRTTVSEFMTWLSGRVLACQPKGLLSELDDSGQWYKNGEFSILPDKSVASRIAALESGGALTFTLRRESLLRRKNTSGYLITMSDVSAYRAMISEVNKQKELAEQASRAKSTFLADMSHEIRTPINAITGMATIARRSDNLEKIHDCLDKVDAASRQLLGLINDILDMSKIEANRMELAMEAFDLPLMFSNIKSIMEISAAAKKQSFTMSIAEDVPLVVVGDDMRLSQIFLNLLSNAVKFTPENGNITLSVKLVETGADGCLLEAAVKDDGVGITKEQQSRLFNSFEQADKGISKRYGGSGLGLAISKSLAELMNGGITLESEPEKGSCFTVWFRLDVSNEKLIAKTAEDQSYDFTGRIALLVEDIAINREIVMTLLQDSGIKVDCVENGQEAVELFFANPERYDIIFMDIHMPVMDGYTATQMIRESGLVTAATVPIMAMTANAFAEDVVNCHLAGMNDHIAKPIEFHLLLRKMARLMSEDLKAKG